MAQKPKAKLSLKRSKHLLTCHKLTKIPTEIQKEKNKLILLSIIIGIIGDIFTFALKGAYHFSSMGYMKLAFTLLILYFLQNIFREVFSTYEDNRKADFNNMYQSLYTKIIMNTVNTVRNKVYTKNGKLMSPTELVFAIKNYLDLVYNFIWAIPENLSNFAMLICMTFGLMFIEFRDSQNLELTLKFFAVLVICTVIYVLLLKIRINIRQVYVDTRRKLKKKEEIYLNDVKNVEPLEEKDFNFHANKLRKVILDNNVSMKAETLKMNYNFIARSTTLALFMVVIMIMNVWNQSLDGNIIFDIVATTTVYEKILSKIQGILSDVEESINRIQELENYYEDFHSITDVYDIEKEYQTNSYDIEVDKIVVDTFEYNYPGTKNVFKLICKNPFELVKGDVILIHGHTGCGKSTFLRLITGKLRLPSSPISFLNIQRKRIKDYLVSLMLEARSILGINPVLEETLLSEDTQNFDFEKLIEILKGVTIYDDLVLLLHLEDCNKEKQATKILDYLRQNQFREFSTGQQQRLLIAKVLYNLNNQQILAFDEITSGLDDETALKVLKFISDYCQRDKKCIIILASHQVEVTKKVCNKEIIFENMPPYSVVRCLPVNHINNI